MLLAYLVQRHQGNASQGIVGVKLGLHLYWLANMHDPPDPPAIMNPCHWLLVIGQEALLTDANRACWDYRRKCCWFGA
jgi:hypothetical protein